MSQGIHWLDTSAVDVKEHRRSRSDWAAAFFTRTSARCPVAASTLMSTSVDTPRVLPFAIAVTRVLDVPALLAISAWVSRLACVILTSATVSSELQFGGM